MITVDGLGTYRWEARLKSVHRIETGRGRVDLIQSLNQPIKYQQSYYKF